MAGDSRERKMLNYVTGVADAAAILAPATNVAIAINTPRVPQRIPVIIFTVWTQSSSPHREHPKIICSEART